MRVTTTVINPFHQFALAKKAPVLTLERERALAQRWRRDGDPRAADELVRAHLGTVTALAAKYRHYGPSITELIAEGNYGLCHALGKYEPERGVRFATYAAHWVRACILAYVLRTRSIVGGNAGAMRSQLFFKFRRERARLTAMLGDGERTLEALAQRLGVSLARVQIMAGRIDAQDVSLDAPAPHDSSVPLIEKLNASHDPEQELLAARFDVGVTAAVRVALSALDSRERYIIEAKVMADRAEALSLAQIGRELGISRERARQLELRALRKLRAAVSTCNEPVVSEWALSVA